MDDAEAFRENVEAERRAQGMSISALGRAAGIPQSNMSRIVHGKESVTLERASRIAAALGKRLSDLLEPHSVVSH